MVLRSNQSKHESLFVATGRGGWRIDEPGVYQVQVCLHLEREDVVSNALTLRVAPPQSREEELLAQDFFTDEVGRTLTFDGSRFFEQANRTLFEVSQRLTSRAVMPHAQIALHLSTLHDGKRLDLSGDAPRVAIVPADRENAMSALQACLSREAERSAETLGMIDYAAYVMRYCDALKDDKSPMVMQSLADTLSQARQVVERRGASSEITDELRRRTSQIERLTKAA